ncbi:MAG: methyltransferase [Flavobacteriales bacterium]|nr:methyltransferase [Flavobacteriales bacterium]
MAKTFDKPFVFKRFSLTHRRCAMKIGTDGVLLGSWSWTAEPKNVLDVGCGSALISLMLAQRYSQAMVDGIDIDAPALEDACENITNSPWKDRVRAFRGNVLTYSFEKKYDLIVCSPPFYVEGTHSPSGQRDAARHANSMPMDFFAHKCSQILSEKGHVCIIYPTVSKEEVVFCFYQSGLYLCDITYVKDNENASLKRVMMRFSRENIIKPNENTLCIREKDGHWSERYTSMMQDFHPDEKLK